MDEYWKFWQLCSGGGLSSSVEAVHSVHDFSLLCIHSLVWPTLLLMNKFKLQAQENATNGAQNYLKSPHLTAILFWILLQRVALSWTGLSSNLILLKFTCLNFIHKLEVVEIVSTRSSVSWNYFTLQLYWRNFNFCAHSVGHWENWKNHVLL